MMRPRRRPAPAWATRLFAACLFSWCLWDSPAELSAQSPTGQPPAADQLLVIQLHHADPQATLLTLQAMQLPGNDTRISATLEGRLIAYGPASALEQIRTVVKEIDAPPEQQAEIRLFMFQNTPAEQAAQVIDQLVQNVTVAVDNRTNALVVSGDRASLDVVGELATQLDARNDSGFADSSYRLQLYWLMEDLQDDTGTEPDPSLGEVLKELERQRFERVRQVGHVSVQVKTGSEFMVRGRSQKGVLNLVGEVREEDPRMLVVELELDVLESQEGESTVALLTEIATPADHNVVLGVAGASLDQPFRRSAFVLRLER